MNNIKTDEAIEIPETSTEFVSQLSANVSTSEPAESISAITPKETEFKNDESGEATETINSLSNELSVKPLKETDKLNWDLVEKLKEFKLNIPKEDHSQTSNGKNEGSCSIPNSGEENSNGLETFSTDSPRSDPKELPLIVVIPTTDNDSSISTNGENGNRLHHYTALPYVVPSEESSTTANQNNLPKSSSDTITVKEQNCPEIRAFRGSNRCGSGISDASCLDTSPIVPDEQLTQTTIPVSVTVDTGSGNLPQSTLRSEHTEYVAEIVSEYDKQATTSATAPATTSSGSTSTTELPDTGLLPQKCKLEASFTNTKTSDYSSPANITTDDKQATTSATAPATTSSGSTSTTELPDTELLPQKCKLEASFTNTKTSDYSSPANITTDDKQATTSATAPATTSYGSTSTTELPDTELLPQKCKLEASFTNTKTSDYSSPANITTDDKQATTSATAPATTSYGSTSTTELPDTELLPQKCKLEASYTNTKTSDYSSSANITTDDKQATTSATAPATTSYGSTSTTELPDTGLLPQKCKLEASYTNTKTSDYSSSAYITTDNKQATTSATAPATTSSESSATTKLSGIESHPKRRKLNGSCIESKTTDKSFEINVTENGKKATTFVTAPVAPSSESSVTKLSGIESHPKRRKLKGSRIESKTTDKSFEINVAENDKKATTFVTAPATPSSESSVSKLSGIESHPKRRKLKSSRIESKTTYKSFEINVIRDGDDTQATTSTTTSGSTKTAELSGSGMTLHSKRRKLKNTHTESKTSDISSAANVTAVETNPSSTTSDLATFTNCYQMFLNIRKQIDKKRKNLFPVQPKPPSGFEGYLMNKRTYILDSNYKISVLNTQSPSPTNLHEQLKKLFVEQEKERQKLRVQHIVEKEKLVLSVEQEILRVHGRAARELANQPLPFSVCTILMDDEVYNIMTPEQEKEKNEKSRSRYNGRIFLSWLQDVDDKWEKIKISLLLRHHNEAESLHAVQKMDWGLKLKELRLCTHSSSEQNIDDDHVPMVLVNDDFDHFPE